MVVDDPSKFADRFSVNSPRLKNWDYSASGIYFITICSLNNGSYFGKIENGQICLSKIGEIAKRELLKTFELRQNIKLLEYVIMPNHIHLLMEIIKNNIPNNCRDVARYVSTPIKNVSTNIFNKKFFSQISPKTNTVSSIIRSFKSSVKRICGQQNLFFAWQSRFYDEIINSNLELFTTKNYIKNNPANWQKDKLYRKSP